MRTADGGGREGTWPSCEVGKEFKVDPEQLRLVTRRLQQDLDTYSSDMHGTKDDLNSRGNIDMRQLGDYPAAHGYYNSLMTVNGGIGEQFDKFTTAYRLIIEGIAAITKTYQDAEHNTVVEISKVQWPIKPTTPRGGNADRRV